MSKVKIFKYESFTDSYIERTLKILSFGKFTMLELQFNKDEYWEPGIQLSVDISPEILLYVFLNACSISFSLKFLKVNEKF